MIRLQKMQAIYYNQISSSENLTCFKTILIGLREALLLFYFKFLKVIIS